MRLPWLPLLLLSMLPFASLSLAEDGWEEGTIGNSFPRSVGVGVRRAAMEQTMSACDPDMGDMFDMQDPLPRRKRNCDRRMVRMRKKKASGCILYMDNRKYKMGSPENDTWTYIENRGQDLPYYVSSRIINRLYARRHGYKFVAKSPSDFSVPGKPRAPAWYKVKFMMEQLLCCCKWALFLDSDAYLRMDDHSLSIESWLSKLTEKDHFESLRTKNPSLRLAHQVWLPNNPLRLVQSKASGGKNLIALFPRNGQTSCFFPPYEDLTACLDFVNSGVFLFRNSSLTQIFLKEWYNDPTPNKDFVHRPWEQYRLHKIISKYKSHIAIVPYLELTGNEGKYIRHFWKKTDEIVAGMRDKSLRNALLGIVALLDAEEKGRSEG